MCVPIIKRVVMFIIGKLPFLFKISFGIAVPVMIAERRKNRGMRRKIFKIIKKVDIIILRKAMGINDITGDQEKCGLLREGKDGIDNFFLEAMFSANITNNSEMDRTLGRVVCGKIVRLLVEGNVTDSNSIDISCSRLEVVEEDGVVFGCLMVNTKCRIKRGGMISYCCGDRRGSVECDNNAVIGNALKIRFTC